jgi:hypothetical protein
LTSFLGASHVVRQPCDAERDRLRAAAIGLDAGMSSPIDGFQLKFVNLPIDQSACENARLDVTVAIP